MAVTALVLGQDSGAMTTQDNDEQPEDGKEPTKRSERKRQREKQRRFDLSNAFDDLAAFIAEVEPEPGDADSDNKKKRKKAGDSEDSAGITRLDLIGRALKIMERLHRENEERKRIISTMQDRGGSHPQQGSNDNVSTSTGGGGEY